MRRSSGSEAIRAVQKILLIDRLQHHGDRALQHFVLECRHPNRASLGSIAFGDMHASHRRCVVRSGLGALQQVLQVLLQVRCVLLRVLAVHAPRAVLARAPIRLPEPVFIDGVA